MVKQIYKYMIPIQYIKKHVLLIVLQFIFLVGILYSYSPCIYALELGYVEFPPYTFTDKNGKANGFLLKLASKVLDRAKIKWHAKPYSAARLYAQLQTGTTNLFLGIKAVPFIQEHIITQDLIIGKIEMRIYAIDEKPLIRKKEDLSGQSVILIRGYSYSGWSTFLNEPSNHVFVVKVSKHVSAFKALQAGRAKYLLEYRYPAEEVLKSINIPNIQHVSINENNLYFIVSKKTPDANNILFKLNQAYCAIDQYQSDQCKQLNNVPVKRR